MWISNLTAPRWCVAKMNLRIPLKCYQFIRTGFFLPSPYTRLNMMAYTIWISLESYWGKIYIMLVVIIQRYTTLIGHDIYNVNIYVTHAIHFYVEIWCHWMVWKEYRQQKEFRILVKNSYLFVRIIDPRAFIPYMKLVHYWMHKYP